MFADERDDLVHIFLHDAELGFCRVVLGKVCNLVE